MKKRLQRIPAKHRREIEAEIKGIARKLQKKREEEGLTQERLAERLDISPMAVQFIEQGRRVPSIPMLLYLLRDLGLKMTIDDV